MKLGVRGHLCLCVCVCVRVQSRRKYMNLSWWQVRWRGLTLRPLAEKTTQPACISRMTGIIYLPLNYANGEEKYFFNMNQTWHTAIIIKQLLMNKLLNVETLYSVFPFYWTHRKIWDVIKLYIFDGFCWCSVLPGWAGFCTFGLLLIVGLEKIALGC